MATNITAPRDDNNVPALLGTNRTNESSPVLLYADPDTHSLIPPPFEVIQNATTTAYVASMVVKAGAGRLKGFTGYNSKTASQWIQVYDSATLPADGSLPKITITVPTVANFAVDFGLIGRYFAVGIVIGNSSTGPTKTIGSADCWFDVQYV